jgi:hypothetical protein
VFRFPPYPPSNANISPITNADWAVGASDDTMAGASGIAVDPTGTYVAVAFAGLSTATNGCTQIFYATNGAVVTNLDLGVLISGLSAHDDRDCSWDVVGNLYYIDNYYGAWRAVSPPGTNQATTVALATIQVGGVVPSVPAKFTSISVSAGLVTIGFTAGTNDTAGSFTLLSAPVVNGSYSKSTNAMITQVATGLFRASVPASGPEQFYRIKK